MIRVLTAAVSNPFEAASGHCRCRRTRRGARDEIFLVEFSIRRPRWVLALVGLLTLLFLTQFPKIRIDAIEAHAARDLRRRMWN
ncbi:MAG: hypothetical protein IPP18_00705 [Rhodocyclaceae bacterium]|nr:hypothetical protein [Rhodocyclaceae bacterium]